MRPANQATITGVALSNKKLDTHDVNERVCVGTKSAECRRDRSCLSVCTNGLLTRQSASCDVVGVS